MNPAQSRLFLVKARNLVVHNAAEIICAAALLLMATNFIAVITRKTLTNDEKYHIPAGYYHLVFGDFQLNPEHPTLVKMVAALRLWFLRPVTPSPTVGPTENPILQGHDTFFVFWEANPDKVQTIAFWARVPMIVWTILFGILLFIYARYLAGRVVAVLAVMLFLNPRSSPNVEWGMIPLNWRTTFEHGARIECVQRYLKDGYRKCNLE